LEHENEIISKTHRYTFRSHFGKIHMANVSNIVLRFQ